MLLSKKISFYFKKNIDEESLRILIGSFLLGWLSILPYITYFNVDLNVPIPFFIDYFKAYILKMDVAKLTLSIYLLLNIVLKILITDKSIEKKVDYQRLLFDCVFFSILLITLGKLIIPFIFILVLFPINNLFIFGKKYLIISLVSFMIIFSISILYQNFWINHKMLGLGLIVTFVILCLYMSKLLDKINIINEELSKLATHDILTDLPNRGLYIEHLMHAMHITNRNEKYCACIFIDLDGFKYVNDTYGHRIGDLLLIEVSKRFTDCLRGSDLVARLGGDEFAIIAQCFLIPEDAIMVSERVLKSLKEIKNIEGNEINVSASIGVAYYKNDGKEEMNVSTFISNADKAMYAAKKAGKKCIRIIDSKGEIITPEVHILSEENKGK